MATTSDSPPKEFPPLLTKDTTKLVEPQQLESQTPKCSNLLKPNSVNANNSKVPLKRMIILRGKQMLCKIVRSSKSHFAGESTITI